MSYSTIQQSCHLFWEVAELTKCAIIKEFNASLAANATTSITIVNGLVILCSSYHSTDYGFFFVTHSRLQFVGGYNYNDGYSFSLTQSNNKLTIKNVGSVGKNINVRWIDL